MSAYRALVASTARKAPLSLYPAQLDTTVLSRHPKMTRTPVLLGRTTLELMPFRKKTAWTALLDSFAAQGLQPLCLVPQEVTLTTKKELQPKVLPRMAGQVAEHAPLVLIAQANI